MKAEIWVMQPQAKEAWSPKKLEETRKYPVLEPSEGAQPRRHLVCGLLVSRAGRNDREFLSPRLVGCL